jgi:hypothetical protein
VAVSLHDADVAPVAPVPNVPVKLSNAGLKFKTKPYCTSLPCAVTLTLNVLPAFAVLLSTVNTDAAGACAFY